MNLQNLTLDQEIQEEILKGQIMQSELVKFQSSLTKELEQKKTELDVMLDKLKSLAKPDGKEDKYIEGDFYQLTPIILTQRKWIVRYMDGEFWGANYEDHYVNAKEAERDYVITHMVEEK